MRIRPYQKDDFSVISQWITEERSHALWCANLIPYPLKQRGFEDFLGKMNARFGDSAFVATTEGEMPVGFFCLSANPDTNEATIKFVVIDSTLRNKGYGCDMIKLAVQYAFETAKVGAVQLNVFPENPRAKRCYEKAGFQERTHIKNNFTFQNEIWGNCNMVFKK